MDFPSSCGGRHWTLLLVLVVHLLLLASSTAPQPAPSSWSLLRPESGVTVWREQEADRPTIQVLVDPGSPDGLPPNTQVCFALLPFGVALVVSGDGGIDGSDAQQVLCLQGGQVTGSIGALQPGAHVLSAFLHDENSAIAARTTRTLLGSTAQQRIVHSPRPLPGAKIERALIQVLDFDNFDVAVWPGEGRVGECKSSSCNSHFPSLLPTTAIPTAKTAAPRYAFRDGVLRMAAERTREQDTPERAATEQDSGPLPILRRRVLNADDQRSIVRLAERCNYNHSMLDSIDRRPAYQRDLWNSREGFPVHNAASLALTAAIIGTLMPQLVEILGNEGFPFGNLTAKESFVRRYRPSERTGVDGHTDRGDITVNCLLSSEFDFVGGMPYRFINPHSVEVVPMKGGECVFHAGSMRHGALPTTGGTRYIVIFFWDIIDGEHRAAKFGKHGDPDPGFG